MDFITIRRTVEENFTPDRIYWTIIACLWIEYGFELYLCLRQVKVLP